MAHRESSRPSNRHRHRESSRHRSRHGKKSQSSRRPVSASEESREGSGSSQALSAHALAQLNRDNNRRSRNGNGGGGGGGGGGSSPAKKKTKPERTKKVTRDAYREISKDAARDRNDRHREKRRSDGKKRRVVSGAIMEEGRARGGLRGGGHWSEGSLEKDYYNTMGPKRRSKKRLWIIGGIVLVLIIVIIIVAVVVSQKNKSDDGNGSSSSSGGQSSNLDGLNRDEVPPKWRNSYLDPWSWESTTDFNLTFTDATVGNLPVMGLFDQWDDSARANENVPPLNEDWGSYSKRPARGVNLGGWLSLEPFITPSLFNYDLKEGIIDEWTLCNKLGASKSKTLEQHYASFITEQTFKDIQSAGLDHVRIPFSYWAVQVYDGEPYLFRTSWRYLLRAIEWARKYGIRVNLDLHGMPGSQNGWNHSGRWGSIGWFNGTDGSENVKRSIEIHDSLSKFFAQPRYKNIISHYGLCNEPRMTFLKTSDVVSWNEQVYKLVRDNGVKALVVFGDGFMGLNNWKGVMPGYDDMVLDVHQYVIFNENQIDFTHQKKVEYACQGWSDQAELAQNPSQGYGGPTIFAEWSQADTDCTKFLTNVGWGNRWEGTFNTGDPSTSVLEPRCPAKDPSQCSCAKANADPSDWSDEYKQFLQMFAEAQMHSFEKASGWWYWTWKTESAPQWSYEAGLKAGVLPAKPWERSFDCDKTVPDFAQMGLEEYY